MATANKWRKTLHRIHPIVAGDLIPANTPAWYNARRGRLTASTRAMLVYNRDWPALVSEIRAELDPDWRHEDKDSVAMAWGRTNEPAALAALAMELGQFMDEPGLVFDSELPFVAATPDSLFTEGSGLVSVQVKCPYNPKRHLDNVYGGGSIKEQYYYQVQWEAWVTRADKILFASYDPRQPRKTQLAVHWIPVNLDIRKQFRENALELEEIIDSGHDPAVGRVVGTYGIPEVFP